MSSKIPRKVIRRWWLRPLVLALYLPEALLHIVVFFYCLLYFGFFLLKFFTMYATLFFERFFYRLDLFEFHFKFQNLRFKGAFLSLKLFRERAYLRLMFRRIEEPKLVDVLSRGPLGEQLSQKIN